jgi:hypothetical protein
MVLLEGLGEFKKSDELIGNRTRDLLACTIKPHPLMPGRVKNALKSRTKAIPATGRGGL